VSDTQRDGLPKQVQSDGSPTEAWFGPHFSDLHPLLQRLHREGGCLSGTVEFATESGIAGLIGKRIMRRLGVSDRRPHRLSVTIRNSEEGLHWSRRFDDGAQVVSLFRPIGRLPDGYWLERAGPIELKLAVDIVDGGWYWRQLGCRIFGVPFPAWLAPRADAHKRIDGEGYRFAVAIALPVVGTVIRYGGTLAPDTRKSSDIA
jgi:Domain of unknown function (DUF4166)